LIIYLQTMTLTDQIKRTINKIPEGKTFRYVDLPIDKEAFVSAAKVLERLQKDSYIKKLSKGVFYKPKKTLFGELKPDYSEQLKPFLLEGEKRIGYETGLALYNRLGLTLQVPFRTKIATKVRKNSIDRGFVKVDFVKSYCEITEDNYQLLGLLDALKDIKDIPDSTVPNSVSVLSSLLRKLPERELNKIVDYSLNYPARVKALLGAILEEMVVAPKLLRTLRDNVNPFSKITIGVSERTLPTSKNWNIQ
jgi:uncharacterized protein YlbG (UPF0298 family)